jgi:hypothetical protein
MGFLEVIFLAKALSDVAEEEREQQWRMQQGLPPIRRQSFMRQVWYELSWPLRLFKKRS